MNDNFIGSMLGISLVVVAMVPAFLVSARFIERRYFRWLSKGERALRAAGGAKVRPV